MATFRRSFTRTGNRLGVWMYRTLNGRMSSGSRNVTVLMITSPGRRTGLPRSTCVRYLDSPDGFVVWGTGSGSRRDPDWFRNLRSTPTVRVQVRSRRLTVEACELAGPVRDSTWQDVVLAAAPEVAKYARKARRTIPIAVLRPRVTDEPAASTIPT